MAVTWRRLAYYDEISTTITSSKIATGESVVIADYEQILVVNSYTIEGTGFLTINDTGILAVL